MANLIDVEVVYAFRDQQTLISVQLPSEATLEQAIQTSGILMRHPDIDLASQKVGIFGKLSRLDAPLRNGDRVEIYRILIADPKEVRRQRVADGKTTRKVAGTGA